MAYMNSTSKILQGGAFETHDIFWGQLASCLECIHAGTTTVVDHSHLNYAKEHRESRSDQL